jgi:hypothetical protein
MLSLRMEFVCNLVCIANGIEFLVQHWLFVGTKQFNPYERTVKCLQLVVKVILV